MNPAASRPVQAETFSGDVDLDVSAAHDVPSMEVKTFSGSVRLLK